ncbi:MAG: outer membrane lipoprotein-sorting protein [Kiritimatiellia bacterium]
MTVLAASILMFAQVAAPSAPALPAEATAAELVQSCRTMIPREITVEGRIVLRNRKGIVQSEHAYALRRTAGRTALAIDGRDIAAPEASAAPQSLLGTDVTWSDITLDYLWWDEFAYDEVRAQESVHGQLCQVVLMKKGDRQVRVWVDRKTGALMQAEELRDGKAVRRLWGTRIKKFDGRWMPSQLEVETLGSGHRTKITVEKLKGEDLP